MTFKSILLVLPVLLSGCSTIQSTSVSNVSKGSGQRITGSDSASGYFRLFTPAIDDLTEGLIVKMGKACDGQLANVQTTLSMREMIVMQSYTVSVTANCVSK
jgi:hypothetical protein